MRESSWMDANLRERLARLVVVAGVFLTVGCGGKDNPALPGRTPRVEADASPGDPPRSGPPEADPSLPDVTFSIDGHVDPGGEIIGCLYVAMPLDRGLIAVPRAESHYTPGSHHFLVYRTTYDSIPPGGGVAHACTDAQQVVGIAGTYYEAQVPDEHRELPKGVAHVFRPGEVLLLTAHYLNTTERGFDTHVDFRLNTMDVRDVLFEAGSIFFYNPIINIPPASVVTVTRRCPLPTDINVALLWSHMHSRGVAFKATTDDSQAAERLGDLYATSTWAEPVPRDFPEDPPATLRAGSTIEYSCTYDNTTTRTIVAGQSAAINEMCILHGMYWPRADSATERCTFGTSR
jgi:hypothetical protein